MLLSRLLKVDFSNAFWEGLEMAPFVPKSVKGLPATLFFFPYSLGIWSQTKSTKLSLKLLTKNQSKYMKASMQ